jgi:hypothetical protein
MSLAGQSLPKWVVRATSAFPSIATELRTSLEVRNVPCADISECDAFAHFTSSKSASCHVLLKNGSSGPFVNLGIPTAATCSNVPASLPRAFARLLSLPVSAGLICRIALVRRLSSANGRAATSAVSVRALAAQRVRLTTSRSQWNYLAAPVVVPGAVFVPVRRTSRRSCRPARRTSRRSCRPPRRS